MSSNYPRQQEEDARRREAAGFERRYDQQLRQQRVELEDWRRRQLRQNAADEARRQRSDRERRRPQ